MVFYGYWRSSAAYRCRIAFNLKGVAPKMAYVHLRKGAQRDEAYRALNRQGLVPSLEVDGRVLTQSLAIIEWLEETRPEPRLLPEDPFERARVRAFAQGIACDVHPLQNLRVLKYLKRELGQGQAAIDAWARHWIVEGLAACEAMAAGEGRFAFGDAPGLADVCLVPQLYNAERFGVDLGLMPRLRAVAEACAAERAFDEAHPDRQADAET